MPAGEEYFLTYTPNICRMFEPALICLFTWERLLKRRQHRMSVRTFQLLPVAGCISQKQLSQRG